MGGPIQNIGGAHPKYWGGPSKILGGEGAVPPVPTPLVHWMCPYMSCVKHRRKLFFCTCLSRRTDMVFDYYKVVVSN